ncbi:MAG: hypothetical protein CMJ46_11060 [Planctomyces sp.]|nr:hypothetical protein [Planctomyces sp.]
MNDNDNNDASPADESLEPEHTGGDPPARSVPSSPVDEQEDGVPPFEDRKTGLILLGVLQVAMGGFFAMMLLFMAAMSAGGLARGPAPLDVRTMIPAMGIYGALAVVLVWLGFGSILARRWARALTLVLAWMWFAVGLVSLLMMFVMGPGPFNVAGNGQAPPQMMMFQVILFGTMGCIYVILPGIYILFYQSRHVKATCDYYDPHIRWTDKCPLPVLPLTLLLASGAFSMVFSASYGFVVPFFGVILKGVPGALVVLLISLLCAGLSWATFKLKMWGWWATLVMYVLFGISTVITFSRISMMDLYREMEFPAAQLEMLEKYGVAESKFMPVTVGVSVILMVGYLLWVRKYFVDGAAETTKS